MIYPIRSIVAGIANLDGSDPVLAPAIELARRTGATLHLVHAFELPDLTWDAYARMGSGDEEALRRFTEGTQARLEARVRTITSSEEVRCHALAGPAVATILEVASREPADLILVGATRRGTLARTILGSTAQRLLQSAPAPILVLRGPLPIPLRRVLLTTDLSPFSAGIHEVALDVLETLFNEDGPEIRSLRVTAYGGEPVPALRSDLAEAATHVELEDFLGERRVRARPVTGVVRVGDPAKEIVAESVEWQADLTVLGTHGRRGPKRWLLGSVAEPAVRSARGSLLVIPAAIEEHRTLPVPRSRTESLVATQPLA